MGVGGTFWGSKIKAFRFRIADSDCAIPDSHCRDGESLSVSLRGRALKIKSQSLRLGMGSRVTSSASNLISHSAFFSRNTKKTQYNLVLDAVYMLMHSAPHFSYK